MGTVLLTGANSSLGLPAAQYLLSNFPAYTAVFTVRNVSANDPNTNNLRALITRFPNSKTSIRKLDLSSLEEVRTFAAELNEEVASGKLPKFASIVCNAMSWTLSDGIKYSADGLELSMAVNHIAQTGLVLRLLQSVDAQNGRIVFLSSSSHRAGSGGFEVYPPKVPQDLDEWVHPPKDGPGEEAGRGFYRYGVSKLAVVMGNYALERRLKETHGLENIHTLAVDPGGLLDSRAFSQADVPFSWKAMLTVANVLQPILRYMNPDMGRSKHAAKDVIDLAVSEDTKGVEGHFWRRTKKQSSPESLVESDQERVWKWTLELSGISKGETVLRL